MADFTHDYVALLRGVNVGGKNKVAMAELRQVFEGLGFCEVQSYINSGNIIFRASRVDIPKMISDIECAIEARFGFAVRVALLDSSEYIEAIESAPAWWGESANTKHNALFMLSPATAQRVLDEVGATDDAYEMIASCGEVVFWSAPMETSSRTRLAKIVNKELYSLITVRNANTCHKIAALMRVRQSVLPNHDES